MKTLGIFCTIFLLSVSLRAQSINIDSLLQTITCDCDTIGGVDPSLLKIAESAVFQVEIVLCALFFITNWVF